MYIFVLFVEAALREWKRQCSEMDISVGDETFPPTFRDDQVTLALDSYDL